MDSFAGKPKVFVQYFDDIAVLYMNNGENRLNLETSTKILRTLDEIESSNAKALITTGVGKFYSNGIDTAWVSKQDMDTAMKFFKCYHGIQRRLLLFPMPTIAALNGHTYAGGAMMALYHDYRIMRTNRGWFCLPEIHLKLRLGKPTYDLLSQRCPPSVVREMAQFGRRYTAKELLATGVADAVTENAGLLDLGISMARDLLGKNGFDRETLTTIKQNLYHKVMESFDALDAGLAEETERFQRTTSKL